MISAALTYGMAMIGVVIALAVLPWLDERAMRKARQVKRRKAIDS